MIRRFYSLVNFYLSSIQQGVQSGHALGELVVKYEYNSPAAEDSRQALRELLTFDKTWVVLNGGTSKDLLELLAFLQEHERELTYSVPFAPFYEDVESLGGIITCVGLILPEEYFGAILGDRGTPFEGDYVNLDPDVLAVDLGGQAQPKVIERFERGSPDWKLISQVKTRPLAR